MALTKRKDITLGSGKLYVQEYTGTTVPDTDTICTADNIIGYISGGATVSYKPTYYTAKDDLGLVSKTLITAEEATLKSGIMTWDGNTLAKLSATARVTETDAASGKPAKRSVKIGGVANDDGKNTSCAFATRTRTASASCTSALSAKTSPVLRSCLPRTRRPSSTPSLAATRWTPTAR